MDLATFFVEVIKALAWPLTLIVFLKVFYEDIRRIIDLGLEIVQNIKYLKFGNIEVFLKLADQKLETEIKATSDKLMNEQDPAEKTRLADELKAAISEQERLRSILMEQATASNRRESVKTFTNPMRRIARQANANEVMYLSTSDPSAAKLRAEDVIHRVRQKSLLLKHVDDDALLSMQSLGLIDSSDKLTQPGYDNLIFWARYELTRPLQD